MSRRITIIDGHPDPDSARLCHALADAYAAGAQKAGHQIHRIDLSDLDFSPLVSRGEWEGAPPTGDIAEVQGAIAWANHVVVIHPLWLGAMPGRLKCLLEQVLRPDFAFNPSQKGMGGGRLKGRSARIIVTMGMPGLIYDLFFFAHSTRSFRRNILEFVGMKPVRTLIIGAVEGRDGARWLAQVERLGEQAI
ncbi:MAG: NAD(P)H-dependent oxidoreductase [Pseudomonadota bacterium]